MAGKPKSGWLKADPHDPRIVLLKAQEPRSMPGWKRRDRGDPRTWCRGNWMLQYAIGAAAGYDGWWLFGPDWDSGRTGRFIGRSLEGARIRADSAIAKWEQSGHPAEA